MKTKLILIALFLALLYQPSYASHIHKAISKGDLATVKKLVKGNPQLLNEKATLYTLQLKNPLQEATPLHWAAYYDQPEIAEFLLKKGAKVNARDKSGFTPLHLAEFKGNDDVVKVLEKYGGKK